MRRALPPPPAYHGNRTSQVPANLGRTGLVYVRRDAHKTPLQRPYTGPYRIIQQYDKYFTVNVDGRPTKITIDRLKPAYITSPEPRQHPQETEEIVVQPAPDPLLVTSRSGRVIKEPVRFVPLAPCSTSLEGGTVAAARA